MLISKPWKVEPSLSKQTLNLSQFGTKWHLNVLDGGIIFSGMQYLQFYLKNEHIY